MMLIIEISSAADIPIPMITETERNREARIAKTDVLEVTVSQGRATGYTLCVSDGFKRSVWFL